MIPPAWGEDTASAKTEAKLEENSDFLTWPGLKSIVQIVMFPYNKKVARSPLSPSFWILH